MRRRKALPSDVMGDNWPKRRRLMYALLLWFVLNAQYLIVFGQDTVLAQNALVTILGAIVATTGSYVFGAVWDDRNKRAHLPDTSLDPEMPSFSNENAPRARSSSF